MGNNTAKKPWTNLQNHYKKSSTTSAIAKLKKWKLNGDQYRKVPYWYCYIENINILIWHQKSICNLGSPIIFSPTVTSSGGTATTCKTFDSSTATISRVISIYPTSDTFKQLAKIILLHQHLRYFRLLNFWIRQYPYNSPTFARHNILEINLCNNYER